MMLKMDMGTGFMLFKCIFIMQTFFITFSFYLGEKIHMEKKNVRVKINN